MAYPATTTAPRALVLDDGEFTVELDARQPDRLASAHLMHRCYEGVTTPAGLEWVGGVSRGADGLWRATLQAKSSGGDTEVAACAERVAAIAALWQSRRSAHCRHQDR